MAESMVGHRFLLPAGSSLSGSYLEVRRIGGYPNSIAFACLYQYIEQFVEEGNSTLKGHFLRLLEPIKGESDQIATFYRSFQANVDCKLLLSAQFFIGLTDATLRLIQRMNLLMNTDYQAVETLIVLAQELHCRGQVIFLSPNSFETRRKINFGVSGPELVTIAANSELYLLYDYIAKDSFFLPECRCLSLKYHIFADLQRASRSYACTIAQLAAHNIACSRCSRPHTKSDLERLLCSSNDHFTLQTDQLKCSHTSEDWGVLCMMCEFEMCGVCFVAQALTAKGPFCAKCKTPYDLQVPSVLSRHSYEWAKRCFKIAMGNRHLEFNEKKQALEQRLIVPSRNSVIPFHSFSLPQKSRSEFHSYSPPAPPHVQAEREPEGMFLLRKCKSCTLLVNYSLCSMGCYCIACAVGNIYSSVDLQKKCFGCNEFIDSFLKEYMDCKGCRQVVKNLDMAYVCLRCKYTICELCFVTLEGRIPLCSTTQVPHHLNILAKLKSLEKRLGRSGSLPVSSYSS